MSGSAPSGGGAPTTSSFASSRDFANAYSTDPTLGDEPEYVQSKMKKTKELDTAPLQCFRKPLTTSQRLALKGTVGKKLRSTFQTIFKQPTESDWDLLWPKKALVTSERLSGAGLSECEHKPLLYWIKSDDIPSADKNDIGLPLFIDFSGGHTDSHMIYPTVYSLAIVPTLLRPMYVHPNVSSYIISGADVMWPGVHSDPDAEAGVGRFQRGEKRCLIAKGQPVPFAVGWMSNDSASVIQASRTGKALSIVHCYMDELWKLGSQKPPNIGFKKDRIYAIRISAQPGAEDEQASDEDDEPSNTQIDAATMLLKASTISVALAASYSPNAPPASWDGSSSTSAAVASPAPAAPSTDAFDDPDLVTPLPVAPPAAADDDSSIPESNSVAAASPALTSATDADESSIPEVATGDAEDASDDDEDGDEEDTSTCPAKLSPSEMDSLLLRCFLFAAQTRIPDSELPMDSSTLFSHMEACNLDSEKLDVKRSTHKKLAKFIKDLGKLGLIKSKTGGGKQGMCSCELKIMSISRGHAKMRDVQITENFLEQVKRKQIEKEKNHAASAAASSTGVSSAFGFTLPSTSGGSGASSSSSSSSSNKLKILYRYRTNERLQRCSTIFPLDIYPVKKLFTQQEVREVVWKYVIDKKLDRTNGKLRLDDILYETFYKDQGDKPPPGVDRNVYKEFLKQLSNSRGGGASSSSNSNQQLQYFDANKSDLMSKIDSNLVEYYAILQPGESLDSEDDPSSLFKRGPLPSIEVSIEVRQRGKQMTRVSGLEIYGVDPMVFAKEAQKMFSCSTSSQTVPANAKHKAIEEIFIQGNVASEIGAKLQAAYGIPQQCVKVAKKK